ncbi:DUF6064 family protein [Gammaproteobacteria bacterium]|nr:DUF6064 family protein [Gammaproteobacteria bacterium]
MNEWWTYDIADLVLFTPGTYFRLFELYHRDWWPVQLACLAMAAVILLCLRLKSNRGNRVIAILLAASWAWVGWVFLHLRFAPIHWIANWYAVAFFLQALLLFIYGVSRRGMKFESGNTLRARIGVFVLLGALLAMPATALITGREWMQTELFAMTPDATALATLGLLLLTTDRAAAWLVVIPVAWCFITGATLWALEAPEAMILPVCAVLTIALMLLPAKRR